MSRLNRSRFEVKSTNWETPSELFNPLHNEFGFTLDVCADSGNCKVPDFFSEHDNGLQKPWNGNTCWLNPPYGNQLVKWLKKAEDERKQNFVKTVALIPSRTNTTWWNNIVLQQSEIRFIIGRPRFSGATFGLPSPLCIVVFNPEHNVKDGCRVSGWILKNANARYVARATR